MNTKSSKHDPTICDGLNKEDLANILLRVHKYAVARSKKYYWLGYVVEPDELVQEAIALAYGIGENETYRNWNKDKYPKLEDFLISIIESITSHKADHARRIKKVSLFDDNGMITDFESNISSNWTKNKENLNSPTPIDHIIKTESLQLLTDKLKSIAEEDEEIGFIILCIEDGISLPREISRETGYDVNKVYNILKRLRIRLKQFKPSSMKNILRKGKEK